MNKLASLLDAMGSVDEPFGLFEPYLYKDKIGDSMWHCELRTTHGVLFEGVTRISAERAVELCYDKIMSSELNYKKKGNL